MPDTLVLDAVRRKDHPPWSPSPSRSPPTCRTAHPPCSSRSHASASPASRRSSASARPERSSSSTPSSNASSISARSRRARTCRASRRSSTTRSARSSSAARPSAPRTSRTRVAETVRERQGALRAEVTIAARYPEDKPAPVSGITTQEMYTLFGSAVASERGTRRLVGVAAQGMTACPCAQELVAASARERLTGRGLLGRGHRAHPRGGPRRHAQPARPGHAVHRLRRGQHRRGRGARPARHRRGLDVERDLRADEAQRRGRRRREGAPPPAVRRGLRARGAARRRRALRRPRRRDVRHGPPGEPRDDPPAQRRRRALRAARRAAHARSSPASTCAHHTSMREWLDG